MFLTEEGLQARKISMCFYLHLLDTKNDEENWGGRITCVVQWLVGYASWLIKRTNKQSSPIKKILWKKWCEIFKISCLFTVSWLKFVSAVWIMFWECENRSFYPYWINKSFASPTESGLFRDFTEPVNHLLVGWLIGWYFMVYQPFWVI